MATYSRVINLQTVTARVNWGPRRMICRSSTGRLWVICQDSTGRYIYARYSDNNGWSWSARETARDFGGTGAQTPLAVAMGSDDQPAVAVRDRSGTTVAVSRRAVGGTWSTGSSYTMGSVNESPLRLMCRSDGRWFMGTCGYNGSTSTVTIATSADAATWDTSAVRALTTFYTAGSGAGDRSAGDFCLDANGDVHFVAGSHNAATGKMNVRWGKYIWNGGSPTWATEETAWAHPSSSTSGYFHPSGIQMVLDQNGDVHAAWICCLATYTTTYQLIYIKGTPGGVWGAQEIPYGAESNLYNIGAVVGLALNGTDPVLISGMTGYGTYTSRYNMHHWKKSSGVWSRAPVTDMDLATNPSPGNICHESHLAHGRFASGFAMVGEIVVGSQEADFFSSSDWSPGRIISEQLTTAPSTGPSYGRISPSTCVRDQRGILHFAGFDATGRYIKHQSSSDGGKTWTAPATIRDCGSTNQHQTTDYALRVDNNGLLVCQVSSPVSGAASVARFLRRSALGVWSEISTFNLTDLTGYVNQVRSLVQLPNGDWWFFYFLESPTRLLALKSTDNLATWAAYNGGTGVVWTGPTTSGNHLWSYGFDCCVDSSGNIHFIAGDSVDVSNYGLIYGKWNGASWTTENVLTTGSNADAYYQPQGSTIAVDSGGIPHVAGTWRSAATAAVEQVWYTSRGGGSWSAAEKLYATDRTGGQYHPMIAIDKNDKPYVLWEGLGWGVNTAKANVQYSTRASGAWVQTAVTDTNINVEYPRLVADRSRPFSSPLTGYAFAMYTPTQGHMFFASPDITWLVLRPQSMAGPRGMNRGLARG